MTAGVSVNDVSVTSVSVSLHVIRVDAKQMTLAVFRQLPSTDVLVDADDLGLKHTWWGTVRYEVDGCRDWLVYSNRRMLFRSPRPDSRHITDYQHWKFRRVYDEQHPMPRWSPIRHPEKAMDHERDKAWKEHVQRFNAEHGVEMAAVEERLSNIPQLFIAL